MIMAPVLLVLSALFLPHCCQGAIFMTVSPYPARVYKDAPPGVPVLTVHGNDNSTGQEITQFKLEDHGMSEYFRVTSSGLLQTARDIDRVIGFKFKFFVFGTINNQVEYTHIIIEVSEKNLYPPEFSDDTYSMQLYRYTPPGAVIGNVSVTDRDVDPYNRHFTIYAPPRQPVLDYVTVTSYGDVILTATPPEDMTYLRLSVMSVDDGSPQLMGNTTVVVSVQDLKQPDTFCLSTATDNTTLCWKNPMPGRDHQGYNVVMQGTSLVLHRHLEGRGDQEEVCISTEEMRLAQNYTFRIKLDTNDSSQVDFFYSGTELTFQKLGQGFSEDCLNEKFAACNFLNPCENGAKCLMGTNGGLDYTCACLTGWQGYNCTQKDLCPSIPCQNNATCIFQGHEAHACQCQADYYGQLCQHRNVCRAVVPCQNGGVCRMYDNGTYSCACPDYFTGADCSVPDPCSPSPCGEGGSCRLSQDGFTTECECDRGFFGPTCSEIDLCESGDLPCYNGGTCVSTGNRSFRCKCTEEYTGSFCETFNACTMACFNNATCTLSKEGNYNCTCLPAFYGDECQHYNRCHDNPCHNGTCNMDKEKPLCECDLGHYGPYCEDFDVCLTNPCGNQGDCVPLPPGLREEGGPGYECQCYESWYGLNCEFPNSCSLGFCDNGATCQNMPPKTFVCRCPRGFYGNDCSLSNPCDSLSEGEDYCSNGGQCFNTSVHPYFWCDCPDGFQGERCDNMEEGDPCRSTPCLNSGTCSKVDDLSYTCLCPASHTGVNCEQELLSCLVRPCSNGGTCEQAGIDNTVRCQCPEGFLGYYCQVPDPCYDGHSGVLEGPCHSGSCESVNRTDMEFFTQEVQSLDFLFRCHCDRGFSGTRCEIAASGCEQITCQNAGDCQNGVCLCPPKFTGRLCEIRMSVCDPDPCGDPRYSCRETGNATFSCVCQNGWDFPECKPVCPAETPLPRKTGIFSWARTFAGDIASAPCPYGGVDSNDNVATRLCQAVEGDRAQWFPPDDSLCRELGLEEATRQLNALQRLTSNPASLGVQHVNNYTSILEGLYVYTLMKEDVASVMMNVISNLGDVNVSVTVTSNREYNTSERLVNLLESYTSEVEVSNGDNVTITSPSFEVLAVDVDDTSSNFTYIPSIVVDNSTTKMNVSITLPSDVLFHEADDPNSSQKVTRLQMIGYRKSQLFIPGDSMRSFMEGQPVITASVKGRQVFNLSSPVVYKIGNVLPKRNYTCVFWDPQNRTWSTAGMETKVKGGNSTECHATHLTSFAVLLDPSPDFVLTAVHEAVLTYISYIGSAVSLFCLMLTIITYGLFRSLNKDKSGKILLHLCVALLLLNAIFLANGLATTTTTASDTDNGLSDDVDACTAVAVLLHYSLLAALAWMLVEAVEMYRALVTVFAKYAQCYMLKRCMVGWGVPAIIVIVTLAVDRRNYDNDGAFCFISRSNPAAYYGSLVAPACLVLLVNTVIFIMVTRVILKPRFQQQKQKETEGVTPAQVRGAFTVMFLLGVTWVFGPLAIREAKVVFNYLFCILNSLQGFLIFVFRCLFNPEVRKCWLQLIKTGTLKKRRGPIRSNVYSDTSSKADAKSGVFHGRGSGDGSNGGGGMGGHSTASTGTMKTTLMHSGNGWHPQLNGFSGRQSLERRGTKFSTLDFYRNSPDASRRGQPITEDQRYGDGDLDDPAIFSAMDYYETGHEGHADASKQSAVTYEELHGDDGVMEYYESIRTSRGQNNSTNSHSSSKRSQARGAEGEQPGTVEFRRHVTSSSTSSSTTSVTNHHTSMHRRSGERSSADRSSAERSSAERSSAERSSAERSSAERSSAKRSSGLKNDEDELTHL